MIPDRQVTKVEKQICRFSQGFVEALVRKGRYLGSTSSHEIKVPSPL